MKWLWARAGWPFAIFIEKELPEFLLDAALLPILNKADVCAARNLAAAAFHRLH